MDHRAAKCKADSRLWALVHLHVSSENVVPSLLPHTLLALLHSPAASVPNHKCLNICLPPLDGILLGPPSPRATFLCAGSQWPHTGSPGVAKAGRGCPPPTKLDHSWVSSSGFAAAAGWDALTVPSTSLCEGL